MKIEREVHILNLDDVLPNRFQPRIKFNEESILELADSIREHGVIQPIVVRKIGEKYEIIAGERRYKASILAGKTAIPAIVTNLDDKDSAEIALIENVQRQDLTPIEEAISYKKILDMGYINQASLAEKLGKTQSTIANKLRLLNLDDEVQEALLEEKISERHARSLLKLNKEEQVKMLNRILEERMTVRKTDEEIMKILNGEDVSTASSTQNILEPQGNNDIEIIDFEEDKLEQQEIPVVQPNMVENRPINPGFMDIDKIEAQAQDIFVQPEITISTEQQDTVAQPEITIPEMGAVEEVPVQEPISVEPVAPQTDVIEPTDVVNQAPIEDSVVNTEIQEPEVKPTVGRFFNMFNMNREEENPNYVSDVEEKEVNMDMQQNIFTSTPQFTAAPIPEAEESGQGNQANLMNQVGETPQSESQVEMQTPEVPENFIVQPNFGNPNPVNVPVQPALESEPEVFQTVNPFTLTDDTEFTNPINSQVEMPLPANQFHQSMTNVELDPVIPTTNGAAEPVVDMKTVINTIRDCVSTIEGFGYTVDEEEMDLEDIYQVTIKIDKK